MTEGKLVISTFNYIIENLSILKLQWINKFYISTNSRDEYFKYFKWTEIFCIIR